MPGEGSAAAPLPPGSTIGILGGGQLGRMLSLAAARLGFKCHVYCPDSESPAFDVCSKTTVAAYDDLAAVDGFAASVDVVTYEFENIDVATAKRIAARVPLRPGARALSVSQDRVAEKNFLNGRGIATALFARVDGPAILPIALEALGRPAILKTRRLGYDGKGQATIRDGDDPAAAFAAIGSVPAIIESRIAFAREVSVIAARAVDGSVAFYDAAENVHREGILHTSTVPAAIAADDADAACGIVRTMLDALHYVGVMGVEFFHVPDGAGPHLLVNEFAPRVHNSGHWTEDACLTSQFENHIRAIAGWPLGATTRHADVVMTNLIGDEADDWRRLAEEPGARLHLYGKREARAGRKMGHVNRLMPRP